MKYFLLGLVTAAIASLFEAKLEAGYRAAKMVNLDAPIHKHTGRDPEDRPGKHGQELREKMWDKTLADSYPASDPPSTIPNPGEDDSMAS